VGEKKGGSKKEAASGDDAEANFGKCWFQVAAISSIEAHPDSDKLFVCQVNVGSGETLQVVTGLQKFYRSEELAGRKVVLIRNLKTAKLAGTVSQAMILAGSTKGTEGVEVVKVLDPPTDSNVGDRIYLEGGQASENLPKQLSSKVWEKVAADLQSSRGKATFQGRHLVTSAGVVIAADLPDGSEIH